MQTKETKEKIVLTELQARRLLSMQLRGRKKEIATKAGVSICTVNNYFTGISQNNRVKEVIIELVSSLG